MLPGLFPSAPRPAWQRGVGMPSVVLHRVPRGLRSYTMAVGRYGYDLLRNNLRPTLAFVSNMGTVTPAGWAFPIGNYGGWKQPTATSPAGQTSHTLEAVVYIGQGTLAGKTATVAFRASGWFGIDISGSVFRAYAYDSATRAITGTTTLVAGNLYVVHATIHNRVLRLYVNGVEEGTPYTLSTEPTWTTGFEIGGGYDQATAVNVLAGGFATYTAWSPGEIQARVRDPWSFLRWPEDDLFFAARGAGGTTYNDTITDALTAADSLLCAITFGADLADSWTLAESAAAAVTFETPIADSVTPGDIFGSGFEAVVTFTTTLEDSATLAESFGAGLTLDVVFSDPVTAADSLAYTLVFSVAIADSVYPGDIGNPSVAAVVFATTVSDSATLGESFIGGFVYTSAISDGWTAGDSLDDSLTLFAQAPFTMLQVTVVVGRIELISGGPDATFTNLTEQQSRV